MLKRIRKRKEFLTTQGNEVNWEGGNEEDTKNE